MTTYNTGNPVPSADARDRFDNSQTFDEAINGELTFYQNRVGNNVLSLKGMADLFQTDQSQRENDFNFFIQSSGYEIPAPYTSGILMQRYTQLIEKDGELYRAKAGVMPFTTTGTWATDSLNLISVGDAVLRQELAGPHGAALVRNTPVAGFSYDLATWSSRIVYAEDFGADPTGVLDSSEPVNRAVAYLASLGGGQLRYGRGKFKVETASLRLATLVVHECAGFGITTFFAAPGSNLDVFKSDDFDTLTGVGPITAAPYGYGVMNATIHGNHLDLGIDWASSWRTSNTILNSSGCGVKAFGTRGKFRLEVFNVADNAIYHEAIGAQFDNSVAGVQIWLDGRISGQEGIIMRGPGDSSLDFVAFGLCGVLPLSQRASTGSLSSKIYPAEQVHGLVIDNEGVYEGHCEVTRVHLYAVSFGYGIKTLGVCRINALHMATDNCLGGFGLSDSTHGFIQLAEARGNGRQPAGYTGPPITPLPDLLLANGGIWSMEIHIKTARYAPSGNDANYAVQVSGSNNLLSITRQGQTQGNGLPLLSPFLKVSGDNNNISFTCKRQRGNAVYLSGNTNNIRGTVSQLYEGAVLTRDTTAGKPCFGNSVDITAEQIQLSGTGFNAVGVASSENIRLLLSGTAGYTKFTGAPMAAVNRAVVWAVMALDGSSINGKSTEDYLEVTVPLTPISGTITVGHNFLYAPDPLQVTPHLRFPGALPDQVLHVGVVSADATNVVFSYRWVALPSSGAVTLVGHIR